MGNGDLSQMMQSDQSAAREEIYSISPKDFEWIVPHHQKQIYRILLFLLQDMDAAETLTQECFMRAYKGHNRFRGESSLATWLAAIAINLAHDHNRNQRWAFWRRLAHTDRMEAMAMPYSGRSPEQILSHKEAIHGIWSVVGKLSERQKTVFLLRFVEEMPLESIAQAMNLEVGTVKAHLFRAVNAVRNACREQHTKGPTRITFREHEDAKREG